MPRTIVMTATPVLERMLVDLDNLRVSYDDPARVAIEEELERRRYDEVDPYMIAVREQRAVDAERGL